MFRCMYIKEFSQPYFFLFFVYNRHESWFGFVILTDPQNAGQEESFLELSSLVKDVIFLLNLGENDTRRLSITIKLYLWRFWFIFIFKFCDPQNAGVPTHKMLVGYNWFPVLLCLQYMKTLGIIVFNTSLCFTVYPLYRT